MTTMLEAVEVSVEKAVGDGVIDGVAHAAMVQALRNLAAKADEGNPNDNVTYPTMLKYMSALGMVPSEVTRTVDSGKGAGSTTEKIKGKFKGYGGAR